MEKTKYLTIDEVSNILGIGKNNTYKLFHIKGFPSIQIGRKLIVEESRFYSFINSYEKNKIFL